MKNVKLAVLCGVALLGLSQQVAAEDGVAQSADQVIAASGGKEAEAVTGTDAAKKPDQPKEELTQEQLAHKLELAKKMHQIRPTSQQIDSAIQQVARRLPEQQRQQFVTIMTESLNYNAIERISIDAMVDVFTLKELEAMVEYYSKPEAVSASDKMSDWAKVVQPEIASLIDKALMKIRLGE